MCAFSSCFTLEVSALSSPQANTVNLTASCRKLIAPVQIPITLKTTMITVEQSYKTVTMMIFSHHNLSKSYC